MQPSGTRDRGRRSASDPARARGTADPDKAVPVSGRQICVDRRRSRCAPGSPRPWRYRPDRGRRRSAAERPAPPRPQGAPRRCRAARSGGASALPTARVAGLGDRQPGHDPIDGGLPRQPQRGQGQGRGQGVIAWGSRIVFVQRALPVLDALGLDRRRPGQPSRATGTGRSAAAPSVLRASSSAPMRSPGCSRAAAPAGRTMSRGSAPRGPAAISTFE